MNADVLLLGALAGIAVLFALGVLLSKDNFYSSLYMTGTLIFVATIYALLNLQPVFVLIVFIFVGAIGIVTVALAATYRSDPERQFSGLWAAPVAVTALILILSIFGLSTSGTQAASANEIVFELANFIPIAKYLLIVVFLIVLVVLLLLSVLKIGVGGRS